jgi:pimeloyl-ACP methyl ester carboxylesterase
VAVRAASSDAPVVVAWHLLDPPRTPEAFAAALPLEGLDAHKLYLGLPLSGARALPGGFDGVMPLIREDALMKFFGAIQQQAIAEFPEAFAELRETLGVATDAKVGLLGGSAGSAVAAHVLASGSTGARAAVLVSPMLRVRSMLDSFPESFQFEYAWHPEAHRLADEMDFIARAPELIATKALVRVIVGADDEAAFLDTSKAFAAVTGADLHVIPGVAHPLADEPGLVAAPQTAAAQRFDALATEWFQKHL